MVQRTRNIHAIPDEKAISQEQALAIGDAALIEKYGDEAIGFDPFIFYIANDPAKPEWRFINVRYWVSVDAYSGEVLTVTDHVEWERTTNKLFGGVDDFIAYVFE